MKWVKEDEVLNHWKEAEKIPDDLVNWEYEVRSKLPNLVAWFRCKIEKDDIEKIYVISSDDWQELTQSFKIVDAVKQIGKTPKNSLSSSINEKKRLYEQKPRSHDRVFILVSPTIAGNYTIIEGNKRAIALLSLKKLVGSQVYLGVSPKIRNYYWARNTPM